MGNLRPAVISLRSWRLSDETAEPLCRPRLLPTSRRTALGGNASYSAQLLHGADYWRTVLDGACGIDIYGHNGVSVGDIDGDGFDDLYVCQPAGLPNRLYRNRGDGTFEDITEASGVGVLENTACALFVDFDNDGRQDLIVVRASGPLLFLNQGGGKFRQKPDAFQFANPPQGTFTGAAVADYDRDGWLDIYFCLYVYYQGTDQYKYPVSLLRRRERSSEFHDAQPARRHVPRRHRRDRPRQEQHPLQLLLRLERLQSRRLARPLCGERFRPQESLPQQWRRNLYRRRRRRRESKTSARA